MMLLLDSEERTLFSILLEVIGCSVVAAANVTYARVANHIVLGQPSTQWTVA
jgi:hypothetical protein